ncbi:hypothetical protein ACF0H5_022372 [Mactra antiquata]
MEVKVLRFLCWCLLGSPLLSAAQNTGACPAGWVQFKQSCYLLHSQKTNWYESELVCKGHHSTLAIVTDKDENDFIKNTIRNAHSGENDAHVWLGAGDDVVEGHFLWYGTDEHLTFTNWGPNEPNSVPLNINEDCLVYWAQYDWEWADYDCHQQCFSVCEKQAGDTEIIG